MGTCAHTGRSECGVQVVREEIDIFVVLLLGVVWGVVYRQGKTLVLLEGDVCVHESKDSMARMTCKITMKGVRLDRVDSFKRVDTNIPIK